MHTHARHSTCVEAREQPCELGSPPVGLRSSGSETCTTNALPAETSPRAQNYHFIQCLSLPLDYKLLGIGTTVAFYVTETEHDT